MSAGARPPMPHVWPSVVHMLADAAKRAPQRAALVCADESMTYLQYAACVTGLARELNALGVGHGARVALVMSNSLDIAIATFAVQASGAQVVPLNPAYTTAELEPMLESAQAHAIFYDLAAAQTLAPLLHMFQPECAIPVGEGARRFTQWRDDPALAEILPLPSPDALSTLQYTGGTTGRSKGVDLIHRSVATNVSQREALFPTEPDSERVLAITPLFHVYAVAMGLYLACYGRGTLVIVPKYRPDVVLDAIRQHRITLMSGSPTIFIGLMAYEGFANYDLTSLRACSSGASALSGETLKRWESATGCTVSEGYGQSESGPVLSYNPRHGTRKLGSVGIAVPGTEIQIVDAPTGTRILPVGEVGEIRARGPQIMQGYRGLPVETVQSLRDGWLYTTDLGELDDDAYLYIRDRKKEMVIVGGFNVYPREVEDALTTHPDVLEAGVVGVADAYRGEALVACVVTCDTSLTQQAITDHLAGRLAKYKIPREVRFVNALPKTSIGKIDKNQLRADVAAKTIT
jgi:long-chain acyl-CoA synthetase